MSRYRKIDVRIWGDEKFAELSERAKLLWFYILTNHRTLCIPGLYSVTESGMAESLGWTLEGFRKPFQELSGKGLVKALWKPGFAGLVWVPNAIKYDPPANPNVVKSWSKWVDDIPECELRDEAFQHLEAFIGTLTEGFMKAFPEPFRKGSGNGSGNHSAALSERVTEIRRQETGDRMQDAGCRMQDTGQNTGGAPEPLQSEDAHKPTVGECVVSQESTSRTDWPKSIASVADLESAVAEFGWSVTGISPALRQRAYGIISAGPISKQEYVYARDKSKDKQNPISYFLSVVDGQRKTAAEESKKKHSGPKKESTSLPPYWHTPPKLED